MKSMIAGISILAVEVLFICIRSLCCSKGKWIQSIRWSVFIILCCSCWTSVIFRPGKTRGFQVDGMLLGLVWVGRKIYLITIGIVTSRQTPYRRKIASGNPCRCWPKRLFAVRIRGSRITRWGSCWCKWSWGWRWWVRTCAWGNLPTSRITRARETIRLLTTRIWTAWITLRCIKTSRVCGSWEAHWGNDRTRCCSITGTNKRSLCWRNICW